ncbi:hypothetical protein Bca52824_095798 [Brassica carinata]|uniref:Uncharacterized protein n=1 Tax=Brassica carinata TaxID=52824 RepID=A0A8X7NYD5_BRACI|nr:hypothetical protein Bca52824_095798 [Brassica carinata]
MVKLIWSGCQSNLDHLKRVLGYPEKSHLSTDDEGAVSRLLCKHILIILTISRAQFKNLRNMIAESLTAVTKKTTTEASPRPPSGDDELTCYREKARLRKNYAQKPLEEHVPGALCGLIHDRERYQKQSSLLSKLSRQLSIHDNRAAAASSWDDWMNAFNSAANGASDSLSRYGSGGHSRRYSDPAQNGDAPSSSSGSNREAPQIGCHQHHHRVVHLTGIRT